MHPDRDHHEPTQPTRRHRRIVIGTALAIALALMIVLHLTGVLGPHSR